MAGINVGKFADLGELLISQNGRDALLVTQGASGEPWNPVIAETTVSIKVLESKFNAEDREFFTVQSNDVKFLIAASAQVTKQQKIRESGLEYTIVDLKVTKPGNVVALYTVQARV